MRKSVKAVSRTYLRDSEAGTDIGKKKKSRPPEPKKGT